MTTGTKFLCCLISVYLQRSLVYSSDIQIASIEQCREWGFDSSNLSCDTCSLLLQHPKLNSEQFQKECKQCCQEYRKNPIIQSDAAGTDESQTHKTMYRKGVFLYGQYGLKSMDEVNDFFEKDLDMLLDSKALTAMQGDPMQAPLLLFFKDNVLEPLKNDPDESILLQKWKRDDIKELILNLLPSKHN